MRIRSFSTPGVFYDLDRDNHTCTCPQFKEEGKCKHLEEVCALPPRKWSPQAVPTFSQGLSAFVKTIRARKVDEAVYWLYFLLTQNAEGGRFRIARRLLIGSAEDGHSITVMERVAKNFAHLCSEDAHLIEYVAEVMRICYVPNWWHTASNGPDYIYCGMVSNRKARLYKEGDDTLTGQLAGLEQAIVDQDKITALMYLERLMGDKSLSRTNLAKHLSHLSMKYENEYARRLTAIHLMHAKSLTHDANFLCQAVWWLAGGTSPVADEIQPVFSSKARELIEQARAKAETYRGIPTHWCDGIHCAGTDRRYAGIWPEMNALCKVFEAYGNVEPTNEWKQEFYELDGIIYE